MSDEALLPCPFCGADARLMEREGKWRVFTDCHEDCMFNSLEAWEFDKRKRAIVLWNRRIPSVSTAELEKLAEKYQRVPDIAITPAVQITQSFVSDLRTLISKATNGRGNE